MLKSVVRVSIRTVSFLYLSSFIIIVWKHFDSVKMHYFQYTKYVQGEQGSDYEFLQ